jgi:hypothetical protein
VGNCGLEWNPSLRGLSHVVLQQQVAVLMLDMQGLQVPAKAKKIVDINNFKKKLILLNVEQSKLRSNLKALLVSATILKKNLGNKKLETRKLSANCCRLMLVSQTIILHKCR